jgi:hypothetical protein
MDSSQTLSQPSASASRTQTQTSAQPPTLILRADPDEQRHIQWAEDVVDNEGMGKKSSKGRLFTSLFLSLSNTRKSAAFIINPEPQMSHRQRRTVRRAVVATTIQTTMTIELGLPIHHTEKTSTVTSITKTLMARVHTREQRDLPAQMRMKKCRNTPAKAKPRSINRRMRQRNDSIYNFHDEFLWKLLLRLGH